MQDVASNLVASHVAQACSDLAAAVHAAQEVDHALNSFSIRLKKVLRRLRPPRARSPLGLAPRLVRTFCALIDELCPYLARGPVIAGMLSDATGWLSYAETIQRRNGRPEPDSEILRARETFKGAPMLLRPTIAHAMRVLGTVNGLPPGSGLAAEAKGRLVRSIEEFAAVLSQACGALQPTDPSPSTTSATSGAAQVVRLG